MANGLMGSLALPDSNMNLIATVTQNCLYAEIDILVMNGTGTDASVQIAITPNSSVSPAPEHFIENGGVARSGGGSIEHTKRIVSAGSKIFAKAAANVVVNVSGVCKTKRN